MNICDCHNDFFCELDGARLQGYVDSCANAGVRFLSGSYWTTKKEWYIFEDLRARKEGIVDPKCFVLHIEDLGFLNDEKDVEKLLEINPFSCSLTWNFDNNFAGGSYGENNLTKNGEKLIKKLQKNNILIDLAHLNKKSFFDVANFIEKPPYVSHTGFCFVRDDKRNLDDEQIRFIVENGGFLGMFFYDKLNTKIDAKKNEFSVKNIAENIADFVERFGSNNLGIGSDFFGIENPPKNLENYDDFVNLESELKKLGISENEVDKIFCNNFHSYLKKIHFDI